MNRWIALGVATVVAASLAACTRSQSRTTAAPIGVQSLRQHVGCGIEGCELVATLVAASPITSCDVDGARVGLSSKDGTNGVYLYQKGRGSLSYAIHQGVASYQERFGSILCYA